jgi:hypothetical protein
VLQKAGWALPRPFLYLHYFFHNKKIPTTINFGFLDRRGNHKDGKIVSVLNEVQYYVTKTYEGAGLKLRSFITSALDLHKWLASRLGRITSGERTRPQSRSWRCGEEKDLLPLLGIGSKFLCCRGCSLIAVLRAKRLKKVVIVKLFLFFFSRGPFRSPLPPPCPLLGCYCINAGQTPSVQRRVCWEIGWKQEYRALRMQ